MTNQEILTKAIEKAIAGGWKQDLVWIHGNIKNPDEVFLNQLDISNTHIYWAYDEYISVPELIYNHDFAKALWGEEPKICSQCDSHHEFSSDCDCGGWPESAIELWQYHLQQMVVSDDPIKYLGEHI